MVRISFHGAAREVTGSCHLVEWNGRRILLDCGLIQGGPESYERNHEPFGFDASSIDVVVLSHAHIDHSGRLPLLVKRGYRGRVVTTEATAELIRIMLSDSGRIHEEDAKWKRKRLEKKGKDASWVKPLYTEEDGLAVVGHVDAVDFEARHDLGGGASVRFIKAGHILGAAIVELTLGEGDGAKRLVFSGDLGVDGARLLPSPRRLPSPDILLMESTYGNRDRDEPGDRTEQLFEIVDSTVRRGGKVIIPAFAVGRTQEILARLNDLVESGRLQGIPVFVDSPMAIEATAVFGRHPQAYSAEARNLLKAGDRPLDFPGIRFTPSADESREINGIRYPAVIISASGMCTAGRIKHHLKYNLDDARNTVLFVGYQARGTLGDLIKSGARSVRIHGVWTQVRASIETIEGFSAHADRAELVAWFEALEGPPGRTFLVHGEESACEALRTGLAERFDARVDVPRLGETVGIP